MSHLMQRFTLALSLAGLLVGAGLARAESDPFGSLSIDEVEALVGKPDAKIFDVNGPEVYAKGHVPGAIWSELDPTSKLPADKATRLVFYCKNER
ncbi:MAG: rhodanese-like domain-containing protein [Anaeromyxobacter sp.]